MKEYVLFIITNHGFADKVMDVAKVHGARGGTILRARGSAGEDAEKFFGVSIQPEKDVVMIILKEDIKNNIMKAISSELGVQTEAHAISFALQVDATLGIS